MGLAAAFELGGQDPLGSRGRLLGRGCRDRGKALGHGLEESTTADPGKDPARVRGL